MSQSTEWQIKDTVLISPAGYHKDLMENDKQKLERFAPFISTGDFDAVSSGTSANSYNEGEASTIKPWSSLYYDIERWDNPGHILYCL